MARIPEVLFKSALPKDKQHIFDSIAESRGRVAGPFSFLLQSPEVAGRVAHLGAYIRFESGLSGAEKELAIITAARENDCGYEWAAHVKLARKAGVRDEAIDAVGRRAPLDSLTEAETAIVEYGRELLRDHRVSDQTFEAARSRFGDSGLIELTTTFGYYAMLACVLNACGAEPPPGSERLPV
ncbi:MAG: carboxymuconolactone decarboxylase family protein [Chloroflexi bacterium]|nr:carboxymuconolactone decarboxylase family protein [Chloroflexota bacterium]